MTIGADYSFFFLLENLNFEFDKFLVFWNVAFGFQQEPIILDGFCLFFIADIHVVMFFMIGP